MTDLARDYERVLMAIRVLGVAMGEGRAPTLSEGLMIARDAAESLARLSVAAGVRPNEIRDLAAKVMR